MDIEIKEVSSLKDLRTFIRFPRTLYRRSPYWVPALFMDEMNTLRKDKNPAFEHCEAKYWLAYREGKMVGRVAAILNQRHASKWGQAYMRFGWIDFIDDPQVSAALLEKVEAWARETGMTAVHGPLGFTDLDREGLLVEGFKELGTLATLYNHPYYAAHLEKAGYRKDTDWMEYEITMPAEPEPTIARMAESSMRRNKLRLLPARSKNDLLPYARELFHLIDEAYQHLYGTIPLTEKQVQAYIDQYFGFVIPEYVPIVLDEHNRIVAFAIVMPSLSRALQKGKGQLLPFGFFHLFKALRKNDRADLYLVGVKPEYQGRGVNAIIMDQVSRAFIARGVRVVETNPELETNRNVQSQWKFFEKRQHKRRRCFIKHLA